MLSLVHPEQTRRLAEKQDEYNALSIADINHPEYGNVMASIWEPTPAELKILNEGGYIQLGIVGIVHPPVALHVVAREEG